jgi:hypothetical protein
VGIAVRIDMHPATIQASLRNPSGPVARFVEHRCQVVENLAKVHCPVDTGRLRASIKHRVRVAGRAVVGTVGTNVRYGQFVHEGTGIYGPRGQWIYPQRGQFLVFQVKRPFGPMPRGKKRPAPGRRPVVFARRVRGTPPTHFLTAGLEQGMAGARIQYHV